MHCRVAPAADRLRACRAPALMPLPPPVAAPSWLKHHDVSLPRPCQGATVLRVFNHSVHVMQGVARVPCASPGRLYLTV